MKKVLVATIFGAVLTANAAAIGPEQPTGSPVLVELFTSQSCSSCVPATIYFEELAKRDDVVALGWHVDYWNALQTRDGRWVDPHSSADYTARQRTYNRNIRSTSSVYTPQIVIGGASEAVGSARVKVSGLVDAAKRGRSNASIFTRPFGDSIAMRINTSTASEAYLVYFEPTANTNVSGGENSGVKFVDINIVTGMKHLGSIDGEATFVTAWPDEGTRCAIIVQDSDLGEVRAAQYCPAS